MLSPVEVPDLIEPVVGFRHWRLVDGSLRSPFAGQRWTSDELHASCPLRRHAPLSAPVTDCSCGIYAWYSPYPLRNSASFVGGVVILWGRIELHRAGMRAACAQIVGLELPLLHGRKRQDVALVAHRLGLPVVAHRKLKTFALEYGRPITRSLRPARLPRMTPLRLGANVDGLT